MLIGEIPPPQTLDLGRIIEDSSNGHKGYKKDNGFL